ncbi:hypothetical protein TNIN_359741 [Trichonephila inaurata madagascariensis]|uniref:RING-type domain-containing protein n=1 Tax=Trichonephila inaurata madagascariensis TaxID=2747483 RepID=A0A8X7BSM4_9ARAC|nr:hypothetical protein TNIN_293431 [Trichonephila inaurata madagascariensis]GFY64364.1 hypothetical protein TNIN_359741 [Trichonephila inaurata madagascariensis]
MFCAICKDRLNSVVEIVSTECGHVFHSECIFKRIEDSKTCPECQKPISSENITKLYFNIAPNDEFDAELVESNIRALSEDLKEKQMELKSASKKMNSLQLQVASVEKIAERKHQEESYLLDELLCINREYALLSTCEKEIERLKRENMRLTGKIGLHKQVFQEDVEEDLYVIHSNIAANVGDTDFF